VPGDYDGDGQHDIAVFREGLWYLLQSAAGLKIVQWGNPSDTPVAVRYDQ
jgi:spore coat protein A, manganese oxidase